MNALAQGLHHVTAIASDPQRNIDFYAGVLGLRLVKKTVNFDDPTAYHLYYGDEYGAPGSIVTFFYWPDAAPSGRVGAGQATRLSFSAAPAALPFWEHRLREAGHAAQRDAVETEERLRFSDPDGIPVEIVAVAADSRKGWAGAGIPVDFALRGFHTVELGVSVPEPTVDLFTQSLGYHVVSHTPGRVRLSPSLEESGRFVDIVTLSDRARGTGGVGTIHHVALRVATDEEETTLQARLQARGYSVSPVRDRNYFRSIYFREPNGILLEIATDQPGFAVDESPDSLGTSLRLPAQFEKARTEIESLLPPLYPAQAYR